MAVSLKFLPLVIMPRSLSKGKNPRISLPLPVNFRPQLCCNFRPIDTPGLLFMRKRVCLYGSPHPFRTISRGESGGCVYLYTPIGKSHRISKKCGQSGTRKNNPCNISTLRFDAGGGGGANLPIRIFRKTIKCGLGFESKFADCVHLYTPICKSHRISEKVWSIGDAPK